jgi:hypothetical protein
MALMNGLDEASPAAREETEEERRARWRERDRRSTEHNRQYKAGLERRRSNEAARLRALEETIALMAELVALEKTDLRELEPGPARQIVARAEAILRNLRVLRSIG